MGHRVRVGKVGKKLRRWGLLGGRVFTIVSMRIILEDEGYVLTHLKISDHFILMKYKINKMLGQVKHKSDTYTNLLAY